MFRILFKCENYVNLAVKSDPEHFCQKKKMFCIQNQIIHTFNVDRHALLGLMICSQIYNENYGQIKIPIIC